MSQRRYSCVFLVLVAIAASLFVSAAPAGAQTLAGGADHSIVLKSDVWFTEIPAAL